MLAQGFDTSIHASLITSWVNHIRRLLDSDYVPHLKYSEPPSTTYCDIPLSPNSKCFLLFNPFDQSNPKAKRMVMEFERFNLFHNKYGKSTKEIWLKDILEVVTTFKPRSFKGESHYQYTLCRSGRE